MDLRRGYARLIQRPGDPSPFDQIHQSLVRELERGVMRCRAFGEGYRQGAEGAS
jgi:hypothetical protein